jgi:succinoglycan biosynthesis transport protein ExoP
LRGARLEGARASAALSAATVEPERSIQEGGTTKLSKLAQRDLSGSFRKDRQVERSIATTRPFMQQVIDEPLSAFAEAFRSIKIAADLSGSSVIGITSTVPAEGKSTVSSNLAQLMAHAGKRVILLDGDLRNPALTRALAARAKVGLVDVLSGQVPLENAIYIDENTGLRFLPAVVDCRVTHSDEVLASDGFKAFVNGLRKEYDYVIVDFSPIAPIVDVRATIQVIDSYMYVIEWGKTQISFVQHQLSRSPELYDRLLGIVLNKADIRVLDRYEPYYYGKQYYAGQHPYRSGE